MVEIGERFDSLESWLDWSRVHPFVLSREEGATIGHRTAEQGFNHPLTGEAIAAETILVGDGACEKAYLPAD